MKCTNLTHKKNCNYMDKVIKLCEKDDRASSWTVKDALEMALKEIEKESELGKQAIILLLDDSEDRYNIRQITAGIGKSSECLALLDVAKEDVMKALRP